MILFGCSEQFNELLRCFQGSAFKFFVHLKSVMGDCIQMRSLPVKMDSLLKMKTRVKLQVYLWEIKRELLLCVTPAEQTVLQGLSISIRVGGCFLFGPLKWCVTGKSLNQFIARFQSVVLG